MLLFVVCFGILLFWLWHELTPPPSYPPGPLGWPVVGNIPHINFLKKQYGFLHLVWAKLCQKYGTIVGLKMGSTRLVLVADYHLIHEACNNQQLQARPDGFFFRIRAMGGRGGLVFWEGPIWTEQKRFCMKHLRNLGLGQSIMEELIAEEAVTLVNYFDKFSNTQNCVEMEGVFDISVLNILWALLAGKRYSRDHADMQNICKTINESFRLLDMAGGILNQMPAIRYIAPSLSGYRDICRLLQETAAFINETILKHKQTIGEEDRDLIDAILHEMNGNNHDTQFTEKDLFIICMDFLQAGTETTSNTLSFFILYMCHYPNVQQKVHLEIDKVIGKDRPPGLPDRKRMPYMTAVIQEVQRIANIAPDGVAHKASEDTTLGEYIIPKDTIVLMLIYAVHMNEKWLDPQNFRPERFLNKSGNIIQFDEFIPFGIGRRRCIGESMAKSTLFIFCCSLMQKFTVEKIGDISKIEVKDGITLTPEPYLTKWKKRI